MIRPHCCFGRTNRCKFQCCQGYWWEYYYRSRWTYKTYLRGNKLQLPSRMSEPTVAALLNCLSKKKKKKKNTKIHFYTNFPPLPLKPQCRKNYSWQFEQWKWPKSKRKTSRKDLWCPAREDIADCVEFRWRWDVHYERWSQRTVTRSRAMIMWNG